jgi:uncharacterized protein (TIGR03067 family)
MKALWLIAGLSVLPLALLAEEGRKSGSAGLEGVYRITGGQEDGKAVPKDRIEGAVVTIKGNTISMRDKETKEFYACTFTLATSKKPWSITMIGTSPKKGEMVRGIIEKKDGEVKLCYALPGADIPTSFTTTKKGQHCFTMKKKGKE